MQIRSWMYNVIAGVLTTAALVGLLWLLAALRLLSFVPLDIADAIIKLMPGAIATQGIEALGPTAKIIIELTGSLIFIVFGGLLAWFYGRVAPRPVLGAGLAAALLAFALTLVVQLIAGTLHSGIPALALTALLYLVWGVAVAWMINRLVAAAAVPDTAQFNERRAFLFRSGGTMLAVAVGSAAIAQLLERSGVIAPQVAGAGQSLPTSAPDPTSAPTSVPTATAQPVEAATTPAEPTATPTAEPTPLPAFVPAPGTRSPFNTNETLYVISSATRDPEIDSEQWQLEIGGAVDAPYTLTYAELLELPRVDQTSTLECISNEVGNYLIGNCKWNGVRLRDLLERAGVQEGVIDIKLTAAEGYTESIPLAKALDPTTLIVYGIDGEALTVSHGFPARLIVPGLYGEKNVKWLTKIESVREDYKGYWQQRGWTDEAIIFTTSVFDTGNPFLGSLPVQMQEGVVPLGGIAFAGNQGISKVEVRINDGAWQEAILQPENDSLTWRFWRYDWAGSPGRHTVALRAVDGTGDPQTDVVREPHPEGASGYHIISIEVVG